MFFGFVFEFIYIIYECTLKNVDVYKYVIYLAFLVLLLALSIISLKRSMKEKYFIQILFLSLYMIIFGGSDIYILSVIVTLLSIGFDKIMNKTKEKLPIGFYLCVSNIIVIIITNFIGNYVI